MKSKKIILHRDQSGDPVYVDPRFITNTAKNRRGTFIELENGFRCTVRESVEEIERLAADTTDVAQ